jgi:hypothetical protein
MALGGPYISNNFHFLHVSLTLSCGFKRLDSISSLLMIGEDPKGVLQRPPLNETNSKRLQKFAIAPINVIHFNELFTSRTKFNTYASIQRHPMHK